MRRNAWGYSYGASAELYEGRYALRAGAFALSRIPNAEPLDTSGSQFQMLAEAEEDHTIFGAPVSCACWIRHARPHG